MPKFTLNDESIRNSYGFKINTAGISLDRFRNNPIMLDGHNSSNAAVIGWWENVRVENGKLIADSRFDEQDENAKKLSGKVERGLIKGVSMGVSFDREDMNMINGELSLEKCELFEASIVAVPSNANSLRLYNDGEIMSESDLKQFCLSVAQNPIEINPKKNKKTMLKLSQLAFIALGFAPTITEASEQQVNASVLALSKQKEDLEAELALSEEKVNAYVAAEKEAKLSATNKILDDAIASGKITADKRATFAALAEQNHQIFIDTLNALPSKKNFGANLSTPQDMQGIATMEDFQKLSTSEQLAFKNQNPQAYKGIIATINPHKK